MILFFYVPSAWNTFPKLCSASSSSPSGLGPSLPLKYDPPLPLLFTFPLPCLYCLSPLLSQSQWPASVFSLSGYELSEKRDLAVLFSLASHHLACIGCLSKLVIITQFLSTLCPNVPCHSIFIPVTTILAKSLSSSLLDKYNSFLSDCTVPCCGPSSSCSPMTFPVTLSLLWLCDDFICALQPETTPAAEQDEFINYYRSILVRVWEKTYYMIWLWLVDLEESIRKWGNTLFYYYFFRRGHFKLSVVRKQEQFSECTFQ